MYTIEEFPKIEDIENWDKIVMNSKIFYENEREGLFIKVDHSNNYYEINAFDYVNRENLGSKKAFFPHVAEGVVANLIEELE